MARRSTDEPLVQEADRLGVEEAKAFGAGEGGRRSWSSKLRKAKESATNQKWEMMKERLTLAEADLCVQCAGIKKLRLHKRRAISMITDYRVLKKTQTLNLKPLAPKS